MKITRFEDIEAWKEARVLNRMVYSATRSPKYNDDKNLRAQMRRASTSIMCNIPEGFDAGSDPEFGRFLKIAARSGTEVQACLYVSLDEKYIDPKMFETLYEQAAKVKRLTGGFIQYLKANPRPRAKTKDQGPRTRDQ